MRRTLVAWCLLGAVVAVTGTAEPDATLERSKRWLTFPVNGGTAKIVLGFLAPVKFEHKLVRNLNCGYNFQANYRILPNFIFPRPESVFKNRAIADYVDSSRKQFYQVLEKAINTWSHHGRSCLLRTVCEVADTPLKHNGLVGEVMDVIFTPQEFDDLDEDYNVARKYGANGVDCSRAYSECPLGHGLLDGISTLVHG